MSWAIAAANNAELIFGDFETTPRAHQRYQGYMNQRMGSRILSCSPLRALLARPQLAEAFLGGLGHIPRATEALIWWTRKAQIPLSILRAWPHLPSRDEGHTLAGPGELTRIGS